MKGPVRKHLERTRAPTDWPQSTPRGESAPDMFRAPVQGSAVVAVARPLTHEEAA